MGGFRRNLLESVLHIPVFIILMITMIITMRIFIMISSAASTFQIEMGGFGSKLWGSALHIPVMITLQLIFIILFGLFTRFDLFIFYVCFVCDCSLFVQYFVVLLESEPLEIAIKILIDAQLRPNLLLISPN